MKRFLFGLLLLGVALYVVALRVPAIGDRVPWLPRPAFLQVAQKPAEGEGGGRRGRRGGGTGAPIPVLVAPARVTDLPVTVDVLGTVQGTNTVTVRAQVEGKLLSVEFGEGQDVRRGDVLARIDPSTFQAAYDQAVAKKAQDASILANAQTDLARYTRLASTQYGSAQQADTQKALVAQTQAILQQDDAAIESAKTTLDYATVRSPIDGRTGLRLVDAGNVVRASDATGLVTVTQVHPIAVVFNLPQQYLRQVNAAAAKGPLRAEARDGADTALLDTGTLQVIDNTVDQTTGTVKLKASFPNDARQLWPGQFVNVRLFVDTLKDVVAVPTTAVQRGPDGPFVYILGPGDTVALRKVEVGRQTEKDSVIAGGLTMPATVVTTGFTRLTDGAKVAVSTGDGAPGAPAGGTGRPPGPDPATAATRGTLPDTERGGAPQPGTDMAVQGETAPAAQPGSGESATQSGRRHGGGRRRAPEGAPAASGGGQP